MKCYKGFDKDLKCRGFQYEIGKEYEENTADICHKGFHACENPMDVFGYYNPADSRYCEVDLDTNEQTEEDSKRVGKKIKIETEIGLSGLIQAGVKFILEKVDFKSAKENNTGTQSAATNTGNQSAATNTGDWSAATNTGNQSAATNTGDWSAATNTGDQSAATNTARLERRHEHGKPERRHEYGRLERRHEHGKPERRHEYGRLERRHEHGKPERRHGWRSGKHCGRYRVWQQSERCCRLLAGAHGT